MLPGVFRVPQQIASITIIAMNQVKVRYVYVIVAGLNIIFQVYYLAIMGP